jgi:hypothetical protein
MRVLRRFLRRLSALPNRLPEMVVSHLEVVLQGDRLAVADPSARNVNRECPGQLRLS